MGRVIHQQFKYASPTASPITMVAAAQTPIVVLQMLAVQSTPAFSGRKSTAGGAGLLPPVFFSRSLSQAAHASDVAGLSRCTGPGVR